MTLAGLLAWNGVVLLLIGSRGTVVLQDSFVIGFANDFVPKATAWILLALAVGGFAAVQVRGLRQRARAGLENDPPLIVALRILGLFVALAAVVSIVNQDRGLPYVALLVGALLVFWTHVLRRTRFGRHVYAVGGNAEAARRAGIDVDRIRIACFAICSLMAAVGGIVLASRLRLGLLGLSSGTKFVVTGCVLLLAVAVDSISRRGREQSGRA